MEHTCIAHFVVFELQAALALLEVIDPLAIVLFLGVHHLSSPIGLTFANLALVIVCFRDYSAHAIHPIVHPVPVVVGSVVKQENAFAVAHPFRVVPIIYPVAILIGPLVFQAGIAARNGFDHLQKSLYLRVQSRECCERQVGRSLIAIAHD